MRSDNHTSIIIHAMNFNELRKKHKQFIYESFEVAKDNGNLKVYFNFTISPDIKFRPQIIFPDGFRDINEDILNNLIFNLGLIEMISYWKSTCSSEIIIRAGSLSDDQIKWWKDLLVKGLGEFFYNNQIDFTKDNLVRFKIESSQPFSVHDGKLPDRDLILIGGGKDSVVTLELLSGPDSQCLLLNPTAAAKNITKTGRCSQPIIIQRIIDSKLLELNQQGYLNGHTPFSAYLAFLATLTAILYDYQNIVVSNEASSSEGNVLFHGQMINHQYSKSLEFEKNFREYSKKYLSIKTNYYSFLRDLNELEIARKFSQMEKYHRIFRSCNVGSKSGIWCLNCSKCLFAYLMLFPFLGYKTKEIFGKDLLDEESLFPVMEELLQIEGKFKPFECVGTKEEIEYAILLSILELKGQKLPNLLEKFKSKISILILGFGREGKSTLEFLKKYFPKQIGTADQKKSKNYLDKLEDYDVIIKSPGIPYLPEIKKAKEEGKIITSSTQLFFDLFKGKIIGVTGTKGKSTTASLTYEVLKSGGLDVNLVGNIGKPALDSLDKVNEDSIVIYELSSFQLADLQKSPQIAVTTNLYPEHLDWHGNFEDYRKAKENIFKYQNKGDFLITNQSGAEAAREVGRLFKISEDKINQVIKVFKSLPHRLEYVGEIRGIKFYNDSLSTIPQATIYALNKLGDNIQTLIAGGFDRGIDYEILGPAIAKSGIKNLILFPETGEKIWQAVEKVNGQQEKFNVSSMEEAVKLAFEKTEPGKIVLLSPASSSFNMFKDYEDRGDQFKKFVLAY